MNNFEQLLDEAYREGAHVYERYRFKSSSKGMNVGNKICLSDKLQNSAERASILAEELGHYHTGAGKIIEQSTVSHRKQELRGRLWGYNRLIGLGGIIDAYNKGCTSRHETAEFLDIPEEYLAEALEYYRGKYGKRAVVDNYIVYFEPHIGVLELI